MNEENNSLEKQPYDEGNDGESEPRLEILGLIESGELAVDEGLERLKQEHDREQGQDVLHQLDLGEIDVQEAIRRIDNQDPGHNEGHGSDFQSVVPGQRAKKLRSWWLIILASGLAGIAFGGWLATLGGWWWLLAMPSLLIGLLVLILALSTYRSPWIHLRINTGESTWPKEINFGFPVPTRWAAWALRKWGPGNKSLEHNAIDEQHDNGREPIG